MDKLFEMRESKGQTPLLDKILGHPHHAYPTIHVAGTNGKGSVSAKTAHGLTSAGYKVGLYTSPHLLNYEERISINGVTISKERAEEGLHKLFGMNFTLNFFEYSTLLAFEYFRSEQVDVAVIEVGVGGEKDPTNIIHPELSIITSISRDHTAMLGDSLEEIARDKAGIIKPHVPVVIGPHADFSPVRARAALCESAMHVVEAPTGYYELENRAIARKALELLSVPSEAIEKGLEFRLPCRFEERDGVILDVAHNPDGFRRLVEALDFHYPGQSYRFLIGMCQDKELKACLKIVAPRASHIHFVQMKNPRSAKSEQLAALLAELGDYSCTMEEDVRKGFLRAIEAGQEKVVVCGSFYIMPEVLQTMQVLV